MVSKKRIRFGFVPVLVILFGSLVWAGPSGISAPHVPELTGPDLNTELENMYDQRTTPGSDGQSRSDFVESSNLGAPREYADQSDSQSDAQLSLAREKKIEADRYKRLSQGMEERGATDQARRLREESEKHRKDSEHFLGRYLNGGGT